MSENASDDKRGKFKFVVSGNSDAQMGFVRMAHLNMASRLVMFIKTDFQKYGDNRFCFKRRDLRHKKIKKEKRLIALEKMNFPLEPTRAPFLNLQCGRE